MKEDNVSYNSSLSNRMESGSFPLLIKMKLTCDQYKIETVKSEYQHEIRDC